jgi:hypothetical protein
MASCVQWPVESAKMATAAAAATVAADEDCLNQERSTLTPET